MLLKLVVLALICGVAMAASKKKPHGHNGILEPYDGKPIPLKITPDQSKKLDKGEAVSCLSISSLTVEKVVLLQLVSVTITAIIGASMNSICNLH